MTRSANAAATGSWVTITTVRPPSSTISRRSASTLAAGADVKRAGRLVGEHHLGPGHQRPGDRDALLLTSGELRGTVRRRFSRPTRAATSRTPSAAADARPGAAAARCSARP